MNDYTNMPDVVLHGKVEEATTVLIEEYAAYGVTEAEIEILGDTNVEFDQDISLAATLENSRKAAVASKNAKRAELAFGMGTVAKKIYANPAVDDAMLSKIGLSPRPVYGSRTTPKIPTNLVATAFSDGRVSLKWGRNGSSTSTIFTIWAIGETGDWDLVSSTGRTKITLSGFTPGEFKSFKVTATVNNQTSPASNIATIYEMGGTSSLSIAA